MYICDAPSHPLRKIYTYIFTFSESVHENKPSLLKYHRFQCKTCEKSLPYYLMLLQFKTCIVVNEM